MRAICLLTAGFIFLKEADILAFYFETFILSCVMVNVKQYCFLFYTQTVYQPTKYYNKMEF